ncbi:triose-phosphate isomerase [Candidatus Uhrbacteria bacterium RIFCSPLOWO2_01_FULL_53_9]|uniref:Triosephosphate isomerase n=1 Tax=Candidatus Uhrbacteria bacterium RIFCSPLOWO2_01_FULL_53_9 TaxID=1802403 RepID=A0A1F7UXP5_9BACT|nr:MAG: triose-phosphate isomerase [Candidatus Uhrbacteria bacterium RIFCSPLOWO2_01_FULL_53_9]
MKTLVANWKMELGVRESVALARGVLRGLRGVKEVPNVYVAPSHTALTDVAKVLGRSRVMLAAQDMHREAQGAYTGFVSAKQLKEVGAQAVILGHSERRAYAGETDADIGCKLALACEHHLDPIICVGEPSAVREAGEAAGYVSEQLQTILAAADMPKRQRLMIAYEPLWAIGTGVTPTIHDVREVHLLIRSRLKDAGMERARVLYGGSVNAQNIYEFINDDYVDGVLVGGASVRLNSLRELINVVSEIG